MQKRALCMALCLALFMSFTSVAAAAESNVKLIINGTTVESEVALEIYDGTAYVSYFPIMQALYPDAVATWEDNKAVAHATGLELIIRPTSNYLEVNGRYLWIDGGFKISGQLILVPVRVLGEALGASVVWDAQTSSILITSGSAPITSGSDAYQADVVYWLSRIIHAESGNQCLEGQIAVGNVVLNRVASPMFPSTVYEVIFQSNQFTPARNGSIYSQPSEQSVTAAKLCLDGANTVGNCLYFVNPYVAPNSWAARNRPYVETIGSHAFFA